jgi:hypothetical protein|tara:strand:- start:106 stop:315 length:210 start_codon:yes stop_codon:yes gene_type:complete
MPETMMKGNECFDCQKYIDLDKHVKPKDVFEGFTDNSKKKPVKKKAPPPKQKEKPKKPQKPQKPSTYKK